MAVFRYVVIYTMMVLFVMSYSAPAYAFFGWYQDKAEVQLSEEGNYDNSYLVPGDPTETWAYSIYQKQYKDVEAEITYLLGLVEESPYVFIRNGKKVKGVVAADFVSYKVTKFRDEISTVEDFIEKVGSYSRTSGKSYAVVYPDKAHIPLKPIYYNELKRLRAIEGRLGSE